MPRILLAAAAMTLALVVAACGGAPAARPSAEAAGLRATFILANPAGLLALDENARTLGRVVDLPANS
ncbi:MAG: hypothetical protein Q7S25_02605, partial [Candidatus Limnocylindria bacterium]|nr:hypothetical protein [Candidatus Limnocylindria bacterium]